jgi:hypothetical protein
MKRSNFGGLLALMLAAVFVLSGCPAEPGEDDAWSAVTGLEQMDGTWAGSYSFTQSLEELFGEFGGEIPDQSFGDITITAKVEMTTTIDAGAKTQAISSVATMTFSGSNADEVYQGLKAFMGMFPEEEDEGLGVTFNDANRSMTMTESGERELSDEYIATMLSLGIEKNQNGTKLKIPAGIIEEASPELILAKK